MTRITHSIEHEMFVRSRSATSEPRGAIVYVHGLGESGLCFEGVIAHPDLDAWRHVAADVPGYGRSAWCAEPLSIATHAERLASWIAERQDDPVVWVGHSMGGVSGLEIAERFPDRVRAFVNVEGNVSPGDCSYSRLACEYTPEAFVERGFDDLLRRLHRDGADDASHRGYYASMAHCDPRQFRLNSEELVTFSEGETAADRMAALRVPVLHVSGVPGGNAPRTLELLDRAGVRRHAIEPAGHWPYLDRRDDFVRVLRAFLEEIER